MEENCPNCNSELYGYVQYRTSSLPHKFCSMCGFASVIIPNSGAFNVKLNEK